MQAVAYENHVMWRARNFMFFAGVILMNYTLLRPSPVDMSFGVVAFLCVFINQRITPNFFILVLLLSMCVLSYFASSLHLLGSSEVRFQIMVKSYVTLLAGIACYVTSSWGEKQWDTFTKVIVFSCTIGAILGIFGFLTQNEILTWDGRAKGLLDDPNMYSSFIVVGMLTCMYRLQKAPSATLVICLALIILAVLLSLSRAALGAGLVCGTLYLVFLNQRNLGKAFLFLMIGSLIVLFLIIIGVLLFDSFADRLAERMVFAKEYDLGHGGRYNRYFLAIPLILDNPLGIGLLQFRLYFEEPIHNIFIGAFLYYGWLNGASWLAMVIMGARYAWNNWVLTRHPISVLLGVSFLAVILCASMHEGEHWRHMWLYLGLVWGFNANNFPRPVRAPAPRTYAATSRAAA